MKIKWILLALLIVCATVSWFAFIVPALARGKQVANYADMTCYRVALMSYKEKHGSFPPTLSPAVIEFGLRGQMYSALKDNWGNPVLYQSRSAAYILVSFGRDGEPDDSDYWKVRQANEYVEVCDNLNADMIASDIQWHHFCGK